MSRCAKCGAQVPESSNFCPYCGGKLREVCNCPWLGRPHNCGNEECPGLGIFVQLKGQEPSGTDHSRT